VSAEDSAGRPIGALPKISIAGLMLAFTLAAAMATAVGVAAWTVAQGGQPSAAQLHSQVTAAYDRGRTAGYKQGIAAGREVGLTAGRKRGFKQGYKAGVKRGNKSGSALGRTDGYRMGYAAGYAAGRKAPRAH
jgi:flagellar biosynthesis/type III secretory pathway protein FliH